MWPALPDDILAIEVYALMTIQLSFQHGSKYINKPGSGKQEKNQE